MKLGCVIMAAGKGRRFGKNKLLELVAGVPLLTRTIRQIPKEAFASLVAVVSSDGAAQLCRREGVRVLQYSGGAQSDTIRLGIHEMADMDGCLFVMGDQPLCNRRSMERMITAFQEDENTVVRLSWKGTASSPVLFSKALFSELGSLTGEQGGASILQRRPEVRVRLVEADSPEELWDSDTREDLERIQNRLLERKRGVSP